METMIIDRRKEAQLDAVFQQFDKKSDCKIKEERTKSKASNLVLMALQDDKKHIDCWDAFGKIGWDKSF